MPYSSYGSILNLHTFCTHISCKACSSCDSILIRDTFCNEGLYAACDDRPNFLEVRAFQIPCLAVHILVGPFHLEEVRSQSLKVVRNLSLGVVHTLVDPCPLEEVHTLVDPCLLEEVHTLVDPFRREEGHILVDPFRREEVRNQVGPYRQSFHLVVVLNLEGHILVDPSPLEEVRNLEGAYWDRSILEEDRLEVLVGKTY